MSEDERGHEPERGGEAPPRTFTAGETVAGENVCPDCDGRGRRDGGESCPTCSGSGRVTEPIGGGG